jgi:hypothetical protein
MTIEYANSTVETLGQWFKSLGGRQDVIYDVRSDKMFDKLRFRMSGAGSKFVVRSVCTVPTSRPVTHLNVDIVSKDVDHDVCLHMLLS